MRIKSNSELKKGVEEKLPKVVREIGRDIYENGGKLYIVGGYIRDHLLGVPSKDIDIEVHGLSLKKVREILEGYSPVTLQGSFGVFKLNKYQDLEIALPRTETRVGEGHQDFEIYIDPYMGSEPASKRRDFTINGIMYDIVEGEILDHNGGVKDLEEGILRHISSKFSEDPLRVLRGIKFATRYNLEIAPETIKLMISLVKELGFLSRERVVAEIEEIILGRYFYKKLKDLVEIVGEYFGIGWYYEMEQGMPYHPEGSVGVHTSQCIYIGNILASRFELSKKERELLLWTLLFHDIGKLSTAGRKGERITFYGHENKGEKILTDLLPSKFGKIKRNKNIIALVKDHLNIVRVEELKGKKVVELIGRHGDNLLILALVGVADKSGRLEEFEVDKIDKSIEKHMWIYKKWKEYLEIYKKARKKYNGHYFIERGVEGSDIGRCQDRKVVEEINSFRKEGRE